MADESWKHWVPDLMTPPRFLFLGRIEVELSNGEVESGTPDRFHWYPETSRGAPVVRKWRSLPAPH
jgi:hypothetical protein